MSDAKDNKKGEHPEPVPDRVSSPDAQAARAAGAGDMASVEKQRTNASDGSLRRYNPENLAAQQHSIELVYEGRTASRTEKKTERELLREMANKPENSTTQDLEGIAKDKSLPEDKRVLAEMIQEMRTQSKALGAPTDALDAYAREALQAELLAKSQTQLPQNDEQDACGSFSYTDAKKGMTIGSHTYASDQLLAQIDTSNGVVSDATNARVSDSKVESTPLQGYVSKPDPWEELAALPNKTQAEVIITAIQAYAENWGREQVDRQFGALIGATEGVGQILQDMATVTDFAHACLSGDEKTAADMGAKFGETIGQMLVAGVNVFTLSDQYLQSVGAEGDWAKPAKDLVKLGLYLDQKWSEIPPKEQERLKYRFVVEAAGNAAMPASSVAVFKAGKFSQVLPNMAKIFSQSATELKQIPADIARCKASFNRLFKNAFGPKLVTSEGVQVGLGDAEELYMMSKADSLSGGIKPSDMRKAHSKAEAGTAKEVCNPLFALDGIDPSKGFETTMRMREKLRAACDQMGIDIDTKNIAFAEVDIPGKPKILIAINGEKSPPGTVPRPKDPKFKTIPDGAMPRDRDSEYKILEEIARDIPKKTTGTIRLFTEQSPCEPSCREAIAQFRKKFKKIDLKTTWAFQDKNERIWAVFEEIERNAAKNAN